MWKYLVVLMLVYNYIESVTSQACSRASMIRDGTCTTQCVPSAGCPEPDSDCLCDSQCGYSCVKKGLSCGPAPTIRNADLTSSGTAFNDTVVYTCQSGYTINGDDVRRCTAKGTWSGVGPTCLPVCQQPDLPFGSYVKTNLKSEYKTGESVTLDCKTGFIKEGNPRRICISGRWTAFPFECKATHSCPRTIRASRTRCTNKCSPDDPVGCPAGHRCLCDGQCGYSCVEQGLQCPSPTRVKNALIKFNNTGYNDTVTYKCQENFTLNGDRVRRCTAKKRWGGAVPSCLPDCGQPRVPQHAYIENKKSKYASGDRVTFKCDAGYNQEGISTTLCFMGRWNVMPFRCDKGGCGDPGTPDNGNKVGISYAPGREVFFSCNIGYVRVGSEKRRCLHNNTWSGTQPTCKLIDCGPPQVLKNGTVIGSETTFQKSISFKCDEGFELDGNPSAICQSDGKWSIEPKCIPVDCGSLDAPLHGSKIGNQSTFTNKILFSCDPGYKLVGSAVRYCPFTGVWDGIQPTCQALDCGVLKAPMNGSIQGDKWTYPNSVSFDCDKGFDLIGSSVRTCQTNGIWGGQTVRCQAVDCGKLVIPQNGSLTGSQTTYPATIKFQCDEGFLLKGSKYRKCQADRTWSGKLTSCEAVSCGKPAFVEYGRPFGGGMTYPNVIVYKCEEGYLLNGPKTRQCQANGTWSGRDPTCDAISCGVLDAPMNGSKIGNVYTYPNDVTFSCDQGFDLIGSKSRVCLSDGSWSGEDTFCKAVDCGPLAVPMNGSLKGSLTTFPTVVMFDCDRGFRMKGSASRRCQANRRWSGSLSTCEAVDCGPLKRPMNGSIFGSATVFPNKISFSCDVGFLLRGSQQRECQANGKWAGETTRCEAVDCGYLPAPRNGSKRGDLTYFPNRVMFYCDKGFKLIGSKIRTCLGNGNWSGRTTYCKGVECGRLAVPTNGSMVGNKFFYPNEIKFSCDKGFVLRGSSLRKCLHFRMWSGYSAHCEAIDCGPLSIPVNGTIRGNLTDYPNTIKFICNRGFDLIGSEERECLSNGTWSGTKSLCKAKNCGPLVAPMNGTMIGKKTVFPNIIRFMCDEGFEMFGSPIRKCLASGKWNGMRPKCRAVNCGVLPLPKNGSVHGSKTVFPNTIRFSCDEGFDLIGSAARTCLPNGTWSGRMTSCKAVDCGPLSAPQNGSKQGSLTVFPNSIIFNCDEGFDLIGSSLRTCTSNRTWDGFHPICKAVDCGPLAVPQNGSKHGSLTVFPNTINFSCDEGFLLRGSSSRVCQANRTWSGILTRCEAIDCGPLAVPMNGTMQGTRTVFPNILTFSCDEGFDLLGSSQRTCLSIGNWSGTQPTCQAVDCGRLAVPQNGSLEGSSTVFPNIITFSCDEGFLLRGSSSRVCQANRTWSGSLTRCEAIDCGPLAVPMNGSMYGSSTVYPNSIEFKCDEGFDLLGPSVRMCLPNGKWNGNQTTCKAVDCGPLAVPQNGSKRGSLTVFPNTIKFSCDEGFLLRGSSSRVCQANRTWSGMLARCQAVDCGALDAPRNGSLQGALTVFPNIITFSCDEGFLLRGSSSRVCQANRTWSGSMTRCEAVNCGQLAVPMNGSMYGNKTVFPHIIKFTCDEGFDLIGSSVRSCLSNGKWSGNRTICEAVDCGPLALPQNGSKHGSLTVFPNTIKFRCDEGFLLHGSSSRICQANRIWSGILTRCEAINCGALSVPMNGSQFGSSTVFPNSITFKCDKGFDLIGSSVRNCLSTGKWDGNSTTCRAIDCGFIPAPMNGSIFGNHTIFPNSRTFQCDEGFDLIGSSLRTCLSNGNWSGTQPSCRAVDCGPLAVPQNGSKHGSLTVFPNTIAFSCDEGFLRRGSSSRVCQANRTWSGSMTRCEAVDCGPLFAPMNGSFYGNKTFFPNSIKFECDAGFDLLGSSERTCLSSGQWSGNMTSCKAVDCGLLAVPQNGSKHGSLTVFPNTITFSCDEGFLLRGSSSRVCQANRTWSSVLTRCEAVDCGSLTVPVNGSMTGNITTFPNSLRFCCDEGFDLLGSSVRTCLSIGKWSGNMTTCKAVDCGHLSVPQNGSKHGSLTVFPNTIAFSCDEGFLLRGSSSRVCQANRTWSGILTRCEAIDCGPLAVPMNGTMQGTKNVFPNILTFSCDEGFDLLGSSKRTCLSNGNWSGTQPTCQAVDCGPLAVPQNGSKLGSLTVFPNTITFSCDEGFLLRGSSSRVCQANRTWSGILTRCEAIVCGPLSVPMNGSLLGNKTFYPNIITFDCDEGFDIIGSTERKCLSNGKWSGSITSCKAVDCGRLATPLNGSVFGSSTVFPNKVSFQCNEGFLLRGPSVRVCQSNRTWSGEETKCQAIDCGSLDVPTNGSLLGDLTVFPNKIRFTCDEGFDLLGSPMRTCMSNGTWSGSRVSCKAVDCGSLAVPMNGSSSGSLTTYPNKFVFTCDKGFILIGSSVRTCLSNRTWSGPMTRCQAVDCGPLAVPMNGTSKGSLTFYPNVITFHCDRGFILSGSSTRQCQASGTWSGNKAVCTVINCGSLLEPRNGFACGERTVFPHSIKFHCDSGFVLIGSPVRRCQANGVWSGTTTYCRAVDCGALDAPMNGTKKGSQTVFPNVVQFGCDEGFILQGSSDRICQANGTWSGDPARCNAVDCGFLAVPMNGSLQGQLTVFPNKIKFSCDVGFDLIGSSVRSCQSNGLWSGSVTTCQAVDCGPLNVPRDGKVAVSGTTYTQRAVFTCYDGFILIANSVRVCQANRTWSGKQPHCNAVDCGKLRPPANGAMRGQLTVFPNKVTFTCKVGFDLVGSPEVKCLASGLWSNSTPTCKAMRCNPPMIPPHSYLTTSHQLYFDNEAAVYFSCKPGFFLRGTPIITCLNGNWTKTEFLCLPPKCKPPHVPDNAYITFPRGKKGPYVENDEVYFSCNNGYYLTGKPSITCQDTWTNQQFTCLPVECGPLPPPERGSIVRSTGTTFGQRYEFGCDWDNGFKLDGSQVRVCQANKEWDGTQPSCYLLSCGEPKTPEHGIKIDFNYTYNNKVRFRCDRGYSPRGYRETRCQINSRWTGKDLICLPCSAPLGLSNRKISSKMLSASSERDPNHSADHGRLFDSSAWCSARSAYEKYLQVDFGSIVEVTAIATQGHPKEYKWVNKYYLKYALGAHWYEYRVNGEIKVFRGNRDRNAVVKRYLEKPIVAHKLRLYRHENTQIFSGSSVCVRMEVYGCTFYTKCLTVGAKVLARWYQWRKQTTYVAGYVSEINEKTIGIVPHDQHSSLTPGTVLMVSKSDPYYILKDIVPQEHEIVNKIPVVMLLRGQDGAAVYPSGKVVNKIGFWYQVNLDNDEIGHWRKLSQIRLIKMPESCETLENNKLEIKK